MQGIRTLRLPEVMRRVGKSRSRIYAMVAARSFPRPIHTGPNTSAWVEHEIDAWLAERIAERDALMRRGRSLLTAA